MKFVKGFLHVAIPWLLSLVFDAELSVHIRHLECLTSSSVKLFI